MNISSMIPWAFAVVAGLWLASLFLIVAFSILRRRIDLRGLLDEPLGGSGAATRPQMLIATFAGVGVYAAIALSSLGDQPAPLPEVPEWLLAVLGGSHATYLVGKGAAASLKTP